MSEEIFGRKYSLTIGRNRELIEQIIPLYTSGDYVTKRSAPNKDGTVDNTFYALAPEYPGAYRDFVTIPPKSINFTELNIEAKITDNKNTQSSTSSQESEIVIYNVSKKNRAFIEVGNSVILKAGYNKDKDLPVIYVGQVVYLEHIKDGENTLTRLFCKPAELANQVKVSKSYPPGSTFGKVLEDLVTIAGNNGIPKGYIAYDPFIQNNPLFFFGYIAQGNLIEVINKLCSEQNYRAYIVTGKLYVESKSLGPQQMQNVVTVSPQDVKKSIALEQDGSGTNQPRSGPPQGIKINLFLNGNITTSAYLKVSFGEYKGNYSIESVKHSLGLESGEWDTEVSCKVLK